MRISDWSSDVCSSDLDPNVARESLMNRDWPAHDIAPLIALVDDPFHKISEEGTYRLSEMQARALLDLRLQRLTALGPDELATSEERGVGKDGVSTFGSRWES